MESIFSVESENGKLAKSHNSSLARRNQPLSKLESKWFFLFPNGALLPTLSR